MRIYTKSGDLVFKTFTFPDGQPHFKLETYEREFDEVTIETALRSPSDLFTLLLVVDVLRGMGYASINLDVRYLLGARMDRAISPLEPHSLATVARLLNGCGFTKVRILDVHSEAATRLIRNSSNVLPLSAATQAVTSCCADVVVAPDKGASWRTQQIWRKTSTTIIYCEKVRDPNTGALSGFKANDYNPLIDGTNVIIVDDICDGGGTFVGLAKELRKAGAKKVSLFVTHGIFSKSLPLEGIDKIYTTNSYLVGDIVDFVDNLVVIPVSMKEL